MARLAKVTGDWCRPTAELQKAELLKLLHTTRSPTSELMRVREDDLELELELVPEATPMPQLKDAADELAHPWFQDSSVQALSSEALEIIAEAGEQPVVRQLTAEEEAALEDAQSESIVVVGASGDTGPLRLPVAEPAVVHVAPAAVPPAVAAASAPIARVRDVAVYPVQHASSSILASLLAILVVLGAATGGVLFAMNIIGPF